MQGKKLNYVFALASTFNVLSNQNAPPGSTVYLISGNDNTFNTLAIQEAIKPIARLYYRNGWGIAGIILPGSSESLANVFETITKESDGFSIDLGTENGYQEFVTKLNSDQSEFVLAQMQTTEEKDQQKFEQTVSIAPGTSEFFLLAVKNNFNTEILLNDPDGKPVKSSNISVAVPWGAY